MQGSSWIALFRRIPTNLHDGLILTLTTGGEVVIQQLIKLDADVLILRGRMAGTQDSGRIIVLPYNQLIAINFTRRLSEKDVTAIFGKNAQSFAADITLSPPSKDDDAELDAATDAAADAEAAQKAAQAKAALPSKADLIAKLRSRLS
jgi:hypothetical protein